MRRVLEYVRVCKTRIAWFDPTTVHMAYYDLDIEEIFSFHPPKNADVKALHEDVRREVKEVAYFFQAELPASPEKTLAIRKLQEAMMYANAAVAIYA